MQAIFAEGEKSKQPVDDHISQVGKMVVFVGNPVTIQPNILLESTKRLLLAPVRYEKLRILSFLAMPVI